ncbi:MAG TPA: hypothetical protein VMV79_01335 [Alphaproteobacteria bacterium]|nr:hypothetical protein [Alphaproteobacteria bacterium]
MPDGSSLGITPASSVTNSLTVGYSSVFPSLASAVPIGELSQNSTELNAIGQLSQNIPTDYYKLDFGSGSAIKMAFGNLNNTDNGQNPFASDLRVQLLNSLGYVVADSQGADGQKTAFDQLTSSSGYASANGTYYVKVSYAPGTTINPQAYNFQLFSGTSYDTKIVTTALTQPYDPNLFVSAADSLNPSSNLTLYTRTATLDAPQPGVPQTPTSIGTLTTNQNELDVVAQATQQVQQDNYNFTVQQGGAIKLSMKNTTNTAGLDVQLTDANGNVLADNSGTQAQQNAYQELTSGMGLSAAAGQYQVKVGFATGQLTGAPQSYNFQLNEGTTYNTIYKTSLAQPSTTANFSAGQNLPVYANSQAQLYTRSDFNTIGQTATGAVNIGWLKANATSLAVSSGLTQADNADYFSFTLQQGNDLKMSFLNQTNDSSMHVQILDSTGYAVLADNQGTARQKAAFTQLTSANGLAAKPGNYMVKVSYPTGADTGKALNYGFQLYSGNSYNNLYQTTTAPESVRTLLLTGGSLGYSPASAAASLLTNATNILDVTGVSSSAATPLSIFGNNLSPFNTNLFA